MNIRFLIALIALVLTLTSLPSHAAQKRALLIGVNDYQASNVSDLNGATNDVDRMIQVLYTRFDFPEQNITVLRDSDATRSGILFALRRIVREAGPEDTVYIHFSGHGSQVRDTNGDETDDAMDETLVPHDGRMPGIADITDDELGELLGQLKTNNVLVVLDSCHSGTGTRSLRLQTRSLPPDNRTELYGVSLRDASPQVVAVEDLDIVLMTGAANHQSALDGPIGEKYYGIFSYSLAKALDVGTALTPRAIFEGVREEFLRIQTQWGGIALPDPQLEGKAARLDGRLFSAENSNSSKRTYLDVATDSDTHVRLLDGERYGASLNSLWGIFPVNDADFSNGPLVTATVSKHEDGHAVAVLDRAIEIPDTARAIEIQPAPTSIAITADVQAPAARRTELAAALRESIGGFKLVDQGAFARFIIEVKDDQVVLLGADGVRQHDNFEWSTAQDVASRLSTHLLRAHASADLVSLTNQASDIDLSVRLIGLEPLEPTRGVKVVETQREGAYRIRTSNAPRTANNSLMLEVNSSHAVYLTIAAVSVDGSIGVLFPNTYQKDSYMPDGLLGANEVSRIPDSLKDDNGAGFHWDIVPPVGHDVIQVFASRDRQMAQDIRRYVAELATETRGRSRGDVRESSQTLRDLRAQIGKRGVGLVPSKASPSEPEVLEQAADWTVRAVRVEVRE